MTFKIKRTPRSDDVVDARLSRLAADLKVQRPEVQRLFKKRNKPMAALAA